ncbi:MAG TPA: amylo-alpha-1,6-glucosidase [Gemmatimonadaceae bacterium]
MRSPTEREWLEADGNGGFASGTVAGVRTRRYHALLLVATTPPTGRMVLVNGFDAWVTTEGGTFALSSQRYVPDVTHPDGLRRIASFESDPWPRWTFELDDGSVVEQEIFVPPDASAVIIAWRLPRPSSGVTLAARPLLSGRDYHALHHENPAFRFDAAVSDGRVEWRPYRGVPGIVARSNAAYAHAPEWYRNFQYDAERERGLDFTEDLASPGIFTWDLSSGEAVWILASAGDSRDAGDAGDSRNAGDAGDSRNAGDPPRTQESAAGTVRRWRAAELARRDAPSRLLRSASAYTVKRGGGKTIIAGYPWFTDWGRDTFIAMRGLCLATGRLDDARDILLQWAGTVSAGMLPNRFPDAGESPEYNSVDASLWFIVAVHDFLEAGKARGRPVTGADRDALHTAVDAILDGYMRGTRYGIRCDGDGLLAAGEPGVQLTWMDARTGDQVVTPRVGKPVEVQALWLTALRIGSAFSEDRLPMLRTGSRAFQERFWNEVGGHLYDVIDVDHHAGAVDASFRPNQILAVGGLPFPLLTGARARRVVDAVEARLLTPMGLRTLAPDDPAYVPHYRGSVRERDAAYHQGTAWPWLIGPFAEAWVRVRGGTAAAKREARERFLAPLLQHLDEAGLGHISEIADGDPPFTPRGCPFQAWSVGEALRLDLAVLAE